jgi:hypothetical protein
LAFDTPSVDLAPENATHDLIADAHPPIVWIVFTPLSIDLNDPNGFHLFNISSAVVS